MQNLERGSDENQGYVYVLYMCDTVDLKDTEVVLTKRGRVQLTVSDSEKFQKIRGYATLEVFFSSKIFQTVSGFIA